MMKHTINIDFNLGDIVYLRTDPEQNPRMITGIMVRPIGIAYSVTFGANESAHYAIELNSTRDVLLSFNNYAHGDI